MSLRILCILGIALAFRVSAQQDAPPVRLFAPHVQTATLHAPQDTPRTAAAASGKVERTVDPRVETLMKDLSTRKLAQPGYRVQVFLGDRRTAEETKRALLLKYPDLPVYLSWMAPNFRLRVGDLRTRLEAERLLRDMKPSYPGSYIVRDDIEPPPLPAAP